MQTVHVTSQQLEAFAFDSGREITLRAHHAELALGQHLFVAPLAPVVEVPQQRRGDQS